MKNQNNFEIKTLFDPLSKEWEQTSYAEKKIMLVKSFKPFNQLSRNLALPSFISRIKNQKLNEDGSEEVEYSDKPLVPYNQLLLATGFYLNKCIDSNYEFPEKVSAVKSIAADLKQLNDRRRKRARSLQEILRKKCGNKTREFFDLPGAEGESSKIPVKREKLKKLQEFGITPLEALYMHVQNYEVMSGKEHVVEEAPYSAFALCWDEDTLV